MEGSWISSKVCGVVVMVVVVVCGVCVCVCVCVWGGGGGGGGGGNVATGIWLKLEGSHYSAAMQRPVIRNTAHASILPIVYKPCDFTQKPIFRTPS